MDILLYGAAGVIWGLAVSIFNNFWGTKALKGDSKGTAMIIFPLRILIYGLAMYLVKFNTAMLIGTVLGLLMIKNLILFKTIKDMIFEKRKG